MVPLGSGTGVLVVVHNVQVIVGVTMIVGIVGAVVAVTMVLVIVGAVNDGVVEYTDTLQFSGTERKKLPCLVRYSKRAE